MSKLVDKERLAKLAKALDERMKATVEAEKSRALAAEKKALEDAQKYTDNKITEVNGAAATLGNRVTALETFQSEQLQNNADQLEAINAKVAQTDYDAKMAKLDAEDKRIAGLVSTEEARAKEVEEDHEERIAANEAFVAAQPAIDAEQDRRIKVLEDDAPVKQAAIEAAQAAAEAADGKAVLAQADVDALEQRLDAEGGLVDRIEANEANIARLDGTVDVEGSVKKQIKDAITEVNGNAEALAGRVQALETFRDDTYPAAEEQVRADFAAADTEVRTAFAAADEQIRKDFAAADAQVLADAKAHAEQKIADLVNGAPEAMDTLNELAKAINDNQDIYDAYVEEHAIAMNTMKSDLQAEIDADVKVVADELAKQKDKNIAGTLANGVSQAFEALTDHQGRLNNHDAKLANYESKFAIINGEGVGSIKYAVAEEKDRAEKAEQALEGRIEAIEIYTDGVDAAIEAAVKPVKEDVDALEGRMDTAEGEIDALQEFVQGHSHEGLQGEIDAVEGRVEALETFKNGHDHSVMQADIAANKAAIEKEVEDRDAAIEEALKVYSTTEEVKQILGNVVNSLALSLEDNKLKLNLGGVDGITIHETTLDMATDADIDAIIAGLDPVEGE